MFKFCLGCIVAVSLLTEAIYAVPDGNAIKKSIEGESEMTPRDSLETFAVLEYFRLANWMVFETYKMYKRALRRSKNMENREVIQTELNEMEAYNQRVREIERIKNDDDYAEKIIELFSAALDSDDKFSTDGKTNPTSNIVEIEKLLKRSGSDVLCLNFGVRFMKLTVDIEEVTLKYIEKLSEAEKQKDAKLIKWYEKLSDEEDPEKRIEYTGDLFDLLEQ